MYFSVAAGSFVFLPQMGLKTIGEIKNAHDTSMFVSYSRFEKRNNFVCVTWKDFLYYYSLYALERHPLQCIKNLKTYSPKRVVTTV